MRRRTTTARDRAPRQRRRASRTISAAARSCAATWRDGRATRARGAAVSQRGAARLPPARARAAAPGRCARSRPASRSSSTRRSQELMRKGAGNPAEIAYAAIVSGYYDDPRDPRLRARHADDRQRPARHDGGVPAGRRRAHARAAACDRGRAAQRRAASRALSLQPVRARQLDLPLALPRLPRVGHAARRGGARVPAEGGAAAIARPDFIAANAASFARAPRLRPQRYLGSRPWRPAAVRKQPRRRNHERQGNPDAGPGTHPQPAAGAAPRSRARSTSTARTPRRSPGNSMASARRRPRPSSSSGRRTVRSRARKTCSRSTASANACSSRTAATSA